MKTALLLTILFPLTAMANDQDAPIFNKIKNLEKEGVVGFECVVKGVSMESRSKTATEEEKNLETIFAHSESEALQLALSQLRLWGNAGFGRNVYSTKFKIKVKDVNCSRVDLSNVGKLSE